MAHIKNRLRGLLVAFVALVAALAIVPGVANALSNDSRGDIAISGFEADDTVTLYKVVDTTYYGNNTIEHTWNSSVTDHISLTIEEYLATADDAEGKGETAEAVRDAVNEAIAAGTTGIATTNNNGTVTATGLEMGQYYVLVTPAEGSQRTYQHMIISVQPTPEVDDEGHPTGGWTEPVQLTDVPQPKYTEETTVEKDITGDEPATGYLPGTAVEFTIKTSIPSYAPNTDWDSTTFTITDTRTNLVSPAGDAYVVTVGAETVAAGEDTYTVTTVGNVTTFTFASDFVKEHQNSAVTIVYTATVAGELDHSKPIENQVLVDPDNESEPGGDSVTLELFQVTGRKTDGTNGLKGAVFSIYRESNNTEGFQADGDTLIANNVTSGADGAFSYDPLAAGDYYLVETQAPAGYQPLTGEVPFSTDAANGENVITISDIVNKKDTTIDLPQTGGAGTVALTAAGVVLVAGAAAFIVRSRKEN